MLQTVRNPSAYWQDFSEQRDVWCATTAEAGEGWTEGGAAASAERTHGNKVADSESRMKWENL